MKIAIVNQTIDQILPPKQTSVGICTYGITHPLASSCEVLVYGMSGVAGSKELGSDFYDRGIHYRLFPASTFDLILEKFFKKYSTSSLAKYFNNGMRSPSSASSWLHPLYGWTIAKDLRAQQCDIIHFQHTSQYIPIVRALNPQAKIVLHLHAEWFPQNNPATLAKRLRHVDLVAGVSHHITEKIRRDFPQMSDRCQTIYNGINPEEFDREKDYEQARQKKEKCILYTGAISPHKGIHILLDAFTIVAQHYPEVHLEIVGPQWPYPIEETFPMNDRALIKKLKPLYDENYMLYLKRRLAPDIASKVSFTGTIPRKSAEFLNRLYNADIFVFPSICNEGFGLPPIEAMAAGVPVVASKSGAVTEVVQDGKTGFLVDKNNASQLATALLLLLENEGLAEEMGRAGRQRAIDFFTWDRAAETALHCYKNLLMGDPLPSLVASIRPGMDAEAQKSRAIFSSTSSITNELIKS
jgi:glycosyltransferase involved in cell wall biosynthesis